MDTEFTYIDEQFHTFEELPFNALDATALSQMAMTICDGLMPQFDSTEQTKKHRLFGRDRMRTFTFCELLRAEDYAMMFNNLDPDRTKRDFLALAASPRFRDMKLCLYQSKFQEQPPTQYGAITFIYKDKFAVVSYRGTDQTLIGWKEDFDMAFQFPVPCQTLALDYLNGVGAMHDVPQQLFVVGHSKGGNMAEYAAIKCEPAIQARIKRVYELDAPGFKQGALTEEDYAPIINRMVKIVPQDSIVGLMLHSPLPMHVAQSDVKGIASHNAFTWKVNDQLTDYVYLNALPEATRNRAAALQVWLSEFTDEQREELVEALFAAMKASGAEDIRPLLDGGWPALNIYLQTALKAEAEDKNVIMKAGLGLAKILGRG